PDGDANVRRHHAGASRVDLAGVLDLGDEPVAAPGLQVGDVEVALAVGHDRQRRAAVARGLQVEHLNDGAGADGAVGVEDAPGEDAAALVRGAARGEVAAIGGGGAGRGGGADRGADERYLPAAAAGGLRGAATALAGSLAAREAQAKGGGSEG